MSFLFGGGAKDVKPEYTGLQLQTSSSILALTLAWGANRFAPNIIWSGDFASHKQKQKAGKGGGGSVTSYTYSVSCMLALCEGPGNGIGKVWKDQDTSATLASIGLSYFSGSDPQAPWGYLVSKHPSEARDYPDVVYLAAANYDLGQQATLPNHSFEVFSRSYQTCKDGSKDADPAPMIDDFLTSEAFGVGMSRSIIDYSTLFSGPDAQTTGDASFQTYCAAQGFGLSPVLTDPTAANDTLDKWTKMCNTATVWTGYSLKFIPFDLSSIDGNGYKYRPNLTTVYTLTDRDFVSDKADPVIVTRTDPSDAYNSMKLTFKDRSNDYNSAPAEWKDQGLIDQYTLRPASTFEANEITKIEMATKVVAIMGQRGAYVRNSHAFTLGPEYCLLEPMDLVEIQDQQLGQLLLQITKISEDEESSNIDCIADEIVLEATSSKGFQSTNVASSGTDTGASPGTVNPPIIFDVPADMSNGEAQVWAAVSGGSLGLGSLLWGGCVVHVSRDDVTYQAIGRVEGAARQGVLTSALAPYGDVNPDTVDTLNVSLLMSHGELMSVSEGDAASGQTLCYVGGEFISFETATLTSPSAYALTNLYRGMHRSTKGAHPINTPFARLDENIFKYTLPPEYIGVPLKFKFQSFNMWLYGFQDLSECVSYDYTPTGKGLQIDAPSSTSLAFTSRVQLDGTNIISGKVTVGNSEGPYLDHYDVQVSVDPYTAWTDLPSIGAGSTTTSFEPALASTNYKARSRAVASTTGGTPSDWVESAIVASGALATVAPGVPTTLGTSGGVLSNKLTWVKAATGGVASKFNIHAINASTGNFADSMIVGTSTIESFTHAGLSSSDPWRYWVTASNFAGESAPLGPQNQTTNASGGGGGSVEVDKDGSLIVASATKMNFRGAGVEVTTPGSGQVNIDIDTVVEATSTGPSGLIGDFIKHTWWRLRVTAVNNPGSSNYVTFAELQFREEVDVSQSPSGGASSDSGAYNGDYVAAKAFDGNISTIFHSGGPAPSWVAYHFPSDGIAVKQIAITTRTDANGVDAAPKEFDVQWSEDGTTWTTEFSVSNAGFNGLGETLAFLNTGVVEGGINYYPTTLDALNDVDTSGAADEQVLTWDSATSKWVPASPPSAGSYRGDFGEPPQTKIHFDEGSFPDDWNITGTVNGTAMTMAQAQIVTQPDAAVDTSDAATFNYNLSVNADIYYEFPASGYTGSQELRIRYMSQGENSYDGFKLFVDGTQIVADLVTSTVYEQYSYTLPIGDHTVRIGYHSDGSNAAGFQNVRFSEIRLPQAATPYLYGDTVTYLDHVWMCLTPGTSATPGDNGDWVEWGAGGGGGAVEVDQDGTQIVAVASKLNFRGDGVTVTAGGTGEAIINVTGGGGGGGASNGRSLVQLGTMRSLTSFTPYNIGGTISLVENPGKAISIVDNAPTGTVTKIAGMYTPVPATTPYRVAAFVQFNNPMYQYLGFAWGFTDGAGKVEIVAIQGGGRYFEHATYDSPTNRVAFNSVNDFPPALGVGFWAGLRDDGTNVWFEISSDGANFSTLFKIAKSTGFLGASGYSNVWLGLYDLAYEFSGADYPISASILDYIEDGLTRRPGDGGGNNGKPWYWSPPLAASLPLTHGSIPFANITDDDDVGLILEIDGPHDFSVAIGKAVSQTADWQITMRTEFGFFTDHYCNIGFSVWNTASGKDFMWAADCRSGNPQMHLFRLNATGYDGYEEFAGLSGAQPTWMRIKYTNATGILQGFMSFDGKIWIPSLTHNIFSDFGGLHPTGAGPGINPASYPHHTGMTIQYLTYQ